MNEASKVMTRSSHAGYEFLMTDVELALTLTRIASHARKDADKKSRNLHNARRAYEKIQQLAPRSV